ncbi:MAG: DEAD/DEAH box helicase family protein, partial [Oscillospiraceae bacterium]
DNLNNEDKYSGYESFDKYLSGDVRQKLAAAQAQVLLGNTCFEQNVAALERSLPPWIEAGEIDVRLGSTWVDCEYYNRFIYETLDISKFFRNSDRGGIFVSYNKFNSNYTVHHKSIERSPDIDTIFGTKRMNALSIIEESLNMKNVVIRDPVHCVTKSGNDSIRYVYNHKETIVARQKQEELREQFRRWIFADSERRTALTQKYNLNFNSIAHRKYDGSGLILPGINPNIELRPHQLNAVARIAGGNNSLLAHVVGAGKTFTMIAGAKEQLRLGIANKVAFVVPNHMITQFADDIFTLYPSSNILVASEHDFETNHRRQFLSRIALSDIEMVVMGHTQFEKISMSPEYTERFLREQIDDITGSIAETKHKEENKFTVKQLETEKKRLETQLKKSLDASKKDNMIIFEQLGINSLFVDEAHSFKNCSINSKMRNVAGISSSNAKKSSDMLMKCRYLTKTNGIITFSTGTPISNSMAETYIMQRYLQNDLLKEKGINHFDEWASTFGETKTSLELAPEGGGYRLRTRFANFHNLSELMQLFRDVADIQTSDMLNLPTPKIHGGKPAVVVCTPSPELEEFMCEAIGRVERIRNREVTPEQDNMLKFTGDAKRAGLDMRLLDRT